MPRNKPNLTLEQIEDIRRRKAEGQRAVQIASDMGISTAAVYWWTGGKHEPVLSAGLRRGARAQALEPATQPGAEGMTEPGMSPAPKAKRKTKGKRKGNGRALNNGTGRKRVGRPVTTGNSHHGKNPQGMRQRLAQNEREVTSLRSEVKTLTTAVKNLTKQIG